MSAPYRWPIAVLDLMKLTRSRLLYAVFVGSASPFSNFVCRRRPTTAGIIRSDLLVTDDQHLAMRFHDAGATGITWMTMRGDDT